MDEVCSKWIRGVWADGYSSDLQVDNAQEMGFVRRTGLLGGFAKHPSHDPSHVEICEKRRSEEVRHVLYRLLLVIASFDALYLIFDKDWL